MSETLEQEALKPMSPEIEAALLENHNRFLAFLEKKVGDRGKAEEILQGAFMRALERGVPAADEQGAVKWFYTVLRNAFVDSYRRQRSQGRTMEEVESEAFGIIETELEANVCSCMHALLPSLKSEYAEMVRQVDLEERTISEVAAATGITPNNATVRLHRARQALKKRLQQSCGACATHNCLDCSCR